MSELGAGASGTGHDWGSAMAAVRVCLLDPQNSQPKPGSKLLREFNYREFPKRGSYSDPSSGWAVTFMPGLEGAVYRHERGHTDFLCLWKCVHEV